MSNKITAEEARKICGGATEDHEVAVALEAAYEAIRTAAANRFRDVNLVTDFWTSCHHGNAYKRAVEDLEKNGFKVRFHSVERQFVEAYTVVEW